MAKGPRYKLRITMRIVEHLNLIEMMRLSYTCKRLYIILGDLRILSRFQSSSQYNALNSPKITLKHKALGSTGLKGSEKMKKV